jgi:hypothetical protein
MKEKIRRWFVVLPDRFSALSKPSQRRILLLLAAFLFASLLWLIFSVEPSLNGTKIGVISIPTVRQSNDKNMRQEQLIPLGKMKGEVNGEFDSFYVAIDKNARIFINRDIDYGPNAFTKNKKWEEITRTKLAEYERDLSFRPINQKSKSLKP